MAASKWIAAATEDIERRGTKGSFTRIAKRMGMSTGEAARHILADKDRYPVSTRKKAAFAKAVT